MALGLFWKMPLSVILCSFLAVTMVHGKICTKEFVHKYQTFKFNTFTLKLIPEEKIKRNITFVCCDGYREISRNRFQPICEPICQHPCGGGYCYGPNLCLCNNGFKLSDQGICKHSEGNKQMLDIRRIVKGLRYRTTTTLTTSTESKSSGTVESSTMQPSSVENDSHKTRSIPYVSAAIQTTIAPSNTKHTRYEVESLTMRTRKKSSKITFPTSPHYESVVNESSTLRTNSKRRNRTHTKLVSNSGEIQEPLEVSKSSNQMSTSTLLPVYHFKKTNRFLPSPKISNISYYSSSQLTNSGVNQVPAAFEYVPNCMWGCFCEPGYELFQGKLCRLCATGSKCKCREGYAFDSKAFQCYPLCNGRFDGCIRGTCIENNVCLCDRDTEQLSGDIFRCYAKEEGEVLQQTKYLKMWYLILLLIPAGLVAFIFCTFIKRRRSAKTNRLEAQKRIFQEVRYFNTSCDETSLKRNLTKRDGDGHTIDDPIFHIQRNANVVVVTI